MTQRSRDEIRDLLEAPFPDTMKTKNARGFTVVAHEDYKRRLIDITDNHFDFEVSPPIIVKEGQVIVRDRDNPGQSYEAPVALVVGHLTIPDFGRRGDWGVNAIQYNQQEDAIKGAVSDCFKRCCALFGLGLDLYEGDQQSSGGRSSAGGQSSGGGGGSTWSLSDKQVNFLKNLLERNNIVVDNVLAPYYVDGDREVVRVPGPMGKAWIDAMANKDNPTIPADLVHLVGQPRNGDPAPPGSSAPTNEAWTEAKLGLGMPAQTQKEGWKARVEGATVEEFGHLVDGAILACNIQEGKQTWRLVLLAKYAPSEEILERIARYANDKGIQSANLDNTLAARVEELGIAVDDAV